MKDYERLWKTWISDVMTATAQGLRVKSRWGQLECYSPHLRCSSQTWSCVSCVCCVCGVCCVSCMCCMVACVAHARHETIRIKQDKDRNIFWGVTYVWPVTRPQMVLSTARSHGSLFCVSRTVRWHSRQKAWALSAGFAWNHESWSMLIWIWNHWSHLKLPCQTVGCLPFHEHLELQLGTSLRTWPETHKSGCLTEGSQEDTF